MKTLIVSLMALALNLGNANAADSSSHKENVAKGSAVGVAAVATFQQLSEENKQLKQQLSSLEDKALETESTLNYNLLMSKMFSHLEYRNQQEQVEELRAEISYNKMMDALFLQLKAR